MSFDQLSYLINKINKNKISDEIYQHNRLSSVGVLFRTCNKQYELLHTFDEKYKKMNTLGDDLRSKLNSIFNELEINAQITGIGSLFGINFNENKINDYRSFIKNDSLLTKILFMGSINNGILMQTKNAGALNTLSSELEITKLEESTRTIATEIKSNI